MTLHILVAATEDNLDRNTCNGITQDKKYCSESMNTDTKPDATVSEVPESLNLEKKSIHLKQADYFRNLVLSVSIIIIVGTLILKLDLISSVMLGCAVVGFNYYWTVKFVHKLLLERKLFILDLLLLLSKFAVSVIVLFGALTYLQLSSIGLLIGLSNVPLAAIVYSFVRLMNPQKFV